MKQLGGKRIKICVIMEVLIAFYQKQLISHMSNKRVYGNRN